MLYGKSVKILKAINYLCKNEVKTSTIDLVVYFNNRVNKLDLVSTIHYLENEDFIEILNDLGTVIEVRPTHIGKHYVEIRIQQFKEFIMKSVLTPIIVAFITALITSILVQ